jgi:hypothetical protein
VQLLSPLHRHLLLLGEIALEREVAREAEARGER